MTYRSGLPTLIIMLIIMWAVQIVGTGTALAIRSWDLGSAWTILTAPFAHGSWSHLLNNTFGLVTLGGLVAASGQRTFAWVTVLSGLVSGVGVFLLNSPGTLTLGASGLVFGYAGYLVTAAIWERRLGAKILKILLALGVLAVWGLPLVIGLLPLSPMVSWQGHLCGGIGGVLASFLLHQEPRPQRNRLT